MRKNNTVTHLKTAILVDGGFYRRRAQSVFGDKTAEERAVELTNYCKRHLNTHGEDNDLYRIFYYDCAPSKKRIYHPFDRVGDGFCRRPLTPPDMRFRIRRFS